jgi:hypothetical protein
MNRGSVLFSLHFAAPHFHSAIEAVGDDSVPTPVRLNSARLAGGRRLELPKLGRVGPVAFPRTGPLRVEAVLAEPRRLALEVTAHEVPADATE